ncbi:aminopeptidase [Agromyces sp. GXS1127]|uniref:aminopeptidase n=1 Tax=Agromyces sp. GXS1127 TaxID=3424181 RepID=UPI003D30F0C9
MADLTTTDLLARYSDVVVRGGLNLRPGQTLVLRALVEHAALVRAIVDAAYDAGAGFVDVEYQDDHVRRSGIVHGAGPALAAGTSRDRAAAERLEQPGVAFLRITGNPDPHLMDDVDAAAVVGALPVELAARERAALMAGGLQWCIVAAPNAGWARAVFGEPDVDRLWRAVGTAVGLDSDDPVAEWLAHTARLRRRAAAVDALDLAAVRYSGPGTDLEIGLMPSWRWMAATMQTTDGVEFSPNVPTEEVFTSPDPARAEGTIATTRPFLLLPSGVLVEGLALTFEGGRIVDAAADRGLDAVLAQLDSDPNARRLGEVALVDGGSRVRRAGVLFHDMLYDENAGSHIAWGQGFPMVVPDGDETGGVNRVAAVHTDVVVGGPGVSIAGVTADGRVVPLITDDVWVLPV